ncbi:MAG: hypothetical protein JWO77_664 [Ilumatobacteraceae bacterium]|nr:hypothetical protein [Ilumatobacteraceae bacterium]
MTRPAPRPGSDARVMHSERRTFIEASPASVWAAILRVEDYQEWWSWLRAFDGHRLVAGDRWRCTVKPPLPYRVRFIIELHEVETASSVAATLDGDIAGSARIDLVPRRTGTDLLLVADLHAVNPWLRRLERWAHPVAQSGHDHIIDSALQEFVDHVG